MLSIVDVHKYVMRTHIHLCACQRQVLLTEVAVGAVMNVPAEAAAAAEAAAGQYCKTDSSIEVSQEPTFRDLDLEALRRAGTSGVYIRRHTYRYYIWRLHT